MEEPAEVAQASVSDAPGTGRPKTRWSDCVTRLAWEHLGILPEELEEVSA